MSMMPDPLLDELLEAIARHRVTKEHMKVDIGGEG
jgi:hypothetical protein